MALWNDHDEFLQESSSIRTATSDRKRQYLDDYNDHIATRLKTPEGNFQIWAHILAAIHLPGTDGDRHADIKLNINPQPLEDDDTEYDDTYRITDTRVSVFMAGCVWHYLEPVNKLNARAILLFRGTASRPAQYRDRDGRLNTEPVGYWADGNLIGVASFSYGRIKEGVYQWMKQQTAVGRDITLVGYSLGGCLAMRALEYYATNEQPRWENCKLYAFSAPGLDSITARALTERFNGRYDQLHAYWHVSDPIPVTGYYPRTTTKAYSRFDPDGVGNPGEGGLWNWFKLGPHQLLYISIPEGWGCLSHTLCEIVLMNQILQIYFEKLLTSSDGFRWE
ncbi:hypothetical protein TrVFT333_011571 [Trichoderma virens FT-333]|nr:hypothetical protein TrVFT333_011571 [Trichoderma virens FT-333]